jgi:hypothetical protein
MKGGDEIVFLTTFHSQTDGQKCQWDVESIVQKLCEHQSKGLRRIFRFSGVLVQLHNTFNNKDVFVQINVRERS